MSEAQELPPESVSSFIDKVLKAKDPAAVGLKKILKKREDDQNDYPLRNASLKDFQLDGVGTKKLSEDERHILELEKKVADLQIVLRQQNERSNAAIQAAYAKGRKEGRETGREDGLKTASESFDKKVDLLQQRIEQMLSTLEVSKRRMVHNTEHILLHLCFEMTKKIVRRQIEDNNDIVLSVLKKALSFIGHHERMVIRVAPRDIETITGRKDFWAPVGERLKDITIESDEQVEPGGCILETNSGMVDAQLGVQMHEIEEMVERTWNDINSAIIAVEDEGLGQTMPPMDTP